MTRFPLLRRLAALATVVLVVSCAVDQSTAPPAPQADLVGGVLGTVDRLAGTLLRCEPLPRERAEKVIGPEGGRLEMGPHTLVIPAGALRQRTRIRGEIRRDTVNSVRLDPEGLRFRTPATLTLSYRNCNLVAGLLTPKRIAYTGENLYIYYWLPSQDQPLQHTVSTRLDHFSRYAVGW